MSKSIVVLKFFGKVGEGHSSDEEQFRALKYGDKILVQLDGAQPGIRKFTGFGLRSPHIATQYMGYDYSYFFVDGSHPKNPQTKYHRSSLTGPDIEDQPRPSILQRDFVQLPF